MKRLLSLLLLLAAFALYVHNLDAHSLWRDEALTITRAQQPIGLILRGRNIVQGVDTPDLHPPLHFLLLHGWRNLVGDSAFAYRYFSVLTMMLALAVIGRVARHVAHEQSDVVVMALLLVSPFCWWYAQETRMYSLVILLCALFLAAWWNVLTRRGTWQRYALFALTALLLVATHYLSVFLVVTALCVLLLVRRLSWRLLVGMGVVTLITVIVLHESIAAVIGNLFEFFATTPLHVLVSQPLTTFWLGSAQPPTQPQWWYVPFVLLLLAGLVIAHRQEKISWWLFAGAGIFGTVVVAYMVGLIRPNYSNPRHLTILLPIVYIVMARGATALAAWHKLLAVVPIGAAVLLSGMSLRQTMLDPPVVRDDVAGMAAYLAPRARSGDLILWHDYDVSVTYELYALEDVPYVTLPRAFQSQESAENELKALLADKRRVWFITARSHDTLVSAWLRDNWTQVGSQTFEGSWIFPNITLFRDPDLFPDVKVDNYPIELEQSGATIEEVAVEDNWLTDGGVWIDVKWAGDGSGSDVCVWLRDSAEKTHTEACRQLLLGMAVRQMLWLPLPRGLPPISYELFVTFGDVTQSLTMIELTPAGGERLAVATYDQLAVESVEWIAEQFTANSWAIGDVVWRVEQPLAQPLRWEARLVDWLSRQVGDVESVEMVSADYPPSVWQTNDVLRATVNIPLSFDADGRYRLQLRRVTDSATSAWQTVGSTLVVPWPLLRELPDGVMPLTDNVQLGEAIKLAAYEIERAGDKLLIDVYWIADDKISADFYTFIHVAQRDQAPLFQDGGIPVNNARPTSTWRRGEMIHDSYEIALSADFNDPGYNVAVGLFDPADGVRLPITVNGERVPDDILILEALP